MPHIIKLTDLERDAVARALSLIAQGYNGHGARQLAAHDPRGETMRALQRVRVKLERTRTNDPEPLRVKHTCPPRRNPYMFCACHRTSVQARQCPVCGQ